MDGKRNVSLRVPLVLGVGRPIQLCGRAVVTAFSHAYICVHFYTTEKPDMDFLYGSD